MYIGCIGVNCYVGMTELGVASEDPGEPVPACVPIEALILRYLIAMQHFFQEKFCLSICHTQLGHTHITVTTYVAYMFDYFLVFQRRAPASSQSIGNSFVAFFG